MSWFEIAIYTSLGVTGSAFCDWQVDFAPPSLKYSNILDAKFGFGKSEIIINSWVFKSWFTSVYLQRVSLKSSRSTILYFILYIVFERLVGFAYLRTSLVDWRRNKFVFIGRLGRTFVIVLGVFTHAYKIINNYFWSTSRFGAWGFWCSTMCVMLYYRPLIKLIITGVSGPKSLLQIICKTW